MSISLLHRPRTRVVLAAASLVLALGTLAGCGGDDSTSSAQDGSAGSSAGASSDAASASGSTSGSDREADGPACSFTADGSEAAKKASLPPDKAYFTGSVDATIETSIGTVKATLDGEAAPCTVTSFTSLADQGYFDDTSCHRLVASSGLSVLQCGDPSGTGRGGPGYSFPDELTGQETYPAGTLAMANAGPDTNGSQFFMVYAESQLPPSYTVFGTIDDASVALITKAADAGTDNANGPGDGAPLTPVDITSVKVAD